MNVRKRSKLVSVLIKLFKLISNKEKKIVREGVILAEKAPVLIKKNIDLQEKEKVDYREMENLLKTDISTENIL